MKFWVHLIPLEKKNQKPEKNWYENKLIIKKKIGKINLKIRRTIESVRLNLLIKILPLIIFSSVYYLKKKN